MNVLILGSGGREHALAWKLRQSTRLDELFIAPGNSGTASCGTNVDLSASKHQMIKDFCIDHKIDMLVVGPEAPLADGIHDTFKADSTTSHITVIGPEKDGATLESSKEFAKDFMSRHKIPTAGYQTFDKDSISQAKEFLQTMKAPFVLKADGLAAGKGVLICKDISEAEMELDHMLIDSKFGAAGDKVVIEEFLEGIEISVFVITDGKSYKILPSAKDYKRIGEGDTGKNTGGMGSVSPVPFADEIFMNRVEERIIKPTVDGLIEENIPYQGFIFFGLMNMGGDPYVIEYNVRMGDPEAESVIPRIKSDLLEAFVAIGDGTLEEVQFEVDDRYCVAVMLVSGGYPDQYEKGKLIGNIEKTEGSIIFHAGTGTDAQTGDVLTNGGRVIAVSSMANNLQAALDQSFRNAALIDFDKKYFRTDLGKDLLKFI